MTSAIIAALRAHAAGLHPDEAGTELSWPRPSATAQSTRQDTTDHHRATGRVRAPYLSRDRTPA